MINIVNKTAPFTDAFSFLIFTRLIVFSGVPSVRRNFSDGIRSAAEILPKFFYIPAFGK